MPRQDAATGDRRQAAAGTGDAAGGSPDSPVSTSTALADASPITHVTPDAPPFLLVHGTADWLVPYAQSEQLHAALTARRGADAGWSRSRAPSTSSTGTTTSTPSSRCPSTTSPTALRRSAMSDLTVAARHRRAPPRAGRHRRDRAAAVLGDHAPSCPTGGRPRTSWRSSPRTGRSGRRVGSTPPSRCWCPGARRTLDQPGAPDRSASGSGAQGAAEPSAWSEDVVVEAGLLDPADWTARADPAACCPSPAATGSRSPCCAGSSSLDTPVVRARLYATAHGVYEAELNGAAVGDQVLAPGWTSYHHRLRYQTYDVTDLLVGGRQRASACTLADGWYRGYLGLRRQAGRLRRPHRRVRAAGGRPRRRDPDDRHQRRLLAVDARAR